VLGRTRASTYKGEKTPKLAPPYSATTAPTPQPPARADPESAKVAAAAPCCSAAPVEGNGHWLATTARRVTARSTATHAPWSQPTPKDRLADEHPQRRLSTHRFHPTLTRPTSPAAPVNRLLAPVTVPARLTCLAQDHLAAAPPMPAHTATPGHTHTSYYW
jgi:hypothetical protein